MEIRHATRWALETIENGGDRKPFERPITELQTACGLEFAEKVRLGFVVQDAEDFNGLKLRTVNCDHCKVEIDRSLERGNWEPRS